MINSSLKIKIISSTLKTSLFKTQSLIKMFTVSNNKFCTNVSSNPNIDMSNLNKNSAKSENLDSDKTLKTSLYLWNSSIKSLKKSQVLKTNFILSNEPTKVKFFDDKPLKYVYCGKSHSGALTEKGELYMFGKNVNGNLGIGNNKDFSYLEPQLVQYFIDKDIKIKKFACSKKNTIALSEEGDVYVWGYGGRSSKRFPTIKNYGCNGEMETVDRWYPGGNSYFLYNGIIIKDIAAGSRHVAALSYDGDVYLWGKGKNGVLGTGKNSSSLTPNKNLFIEHIRDMNPEERVIKIDCAGQYTAALTKSGNIYAWGINNQGQLGNGGGTGKEYKDTEKLPSLVSKSDPGIKYVDFSCGVNTMLIKDEMGYLYKTGLKINYVPGIIELSKTVKPKSFFCGRSFYCMIDYDDNIYQWGNLFKDSKTEKSDNDMVMIKSKDSFNGKKILSISSKLTISAAIVQEN